MSSAAAKYRELLATLLVERELAGGSLPEDDESRYVEELDRCWWAMTSSEQAEIETTMATDATIDAPGELDSVDVLVTKGEHRLPRQPTQQAA